MKITNIHMLKFFIVLLITQTTLHCMTQDEKTWHKEHEVKEASFDKKVEELDLLFSSAGIPDEIFRIHFAPTLLGTINNNGGLIRALDCIFRNVDTTPKLKEVFTPLLLAPYINADYFSYLSILFDGAWRAHENTIVTLYYFFIFQSNRSGRNPDVVKDPFAILAFVNDNEYIFKILLKLGLVNIHLLDAEGKTILDRLWILRSKNLVQYVLTIPDFNVNLAGEGGSTLLHRADQDFWERLISLRANVNAQNSAGDTRLHLLAREFVGYIRSRKNDNSYMITTHWNKLVAWGMFLQSRGGRLDIRNKAGETVQDILNTLSADGLRPAFAIRFS